MTLFPLNDPIYILFEKVPFEDVRCSILLSFSAGRRWWSKRRRARELARNLDDTNGSISPSQYCPDPNGIKREEGRK